MIAYRVTNLSLLAVLVVMSASFARGHIRGVDDPKRSVERSNSKHAKARGKARNNAQTRRHALQSLRAMDGIGRVSGSGNRDHAEELVKSVQSRIVGGTAASSGEYKFFASWDIGCGGSLIAPNIILTAAHCGDQDNGSVRIGSNLYSSGGITRRVTQQCKHPKYDSSLDIFDFMLLTLDSPVDTTKFPVIELNSDKSQPQVNEMLTVIGFGATKEGGSQSSTLLKVEVPANSNTECLKQYPGIVEAVNLCAGYTSGGKDSCQGDSGGPIFELRNGVPVQVGVVSFGDGCARPNRSGVYSRLSGGYDWIQKTMTKLNSGDLSGCGGSGNPAPVSAPIDSRPAGTSPTRKPVNTPTPKPVNSPTPKPVISPTPKPAAGSLPTGDSPTLEFSPTLDGSPTTDDAPTVEDPTEDSPSLIAPTMDTRPTVPTQDDDDFVTDDDNGNNNDDDKTDDDNLFNR
jgi:trypsin